MMRYLKQEEKNRTRVLYEASFPEDSKAFADYYYTYRILNNRILVLEQEEAAGGIGQDPSKLQAMVHLNPYRFSVCGQETEVPYIVAVATDRTVRRQGKMSLLLSKALCDMAKEQRPFAFLIPANPEVYRSSGFVFIPTEQYEEYDGREDALAFPQRSREDALAFPQRSREELRAAEVKPAREPLAEEVKPAREPSEEKVWFGQQPSADPWRRNPEKTLNYGEHTFFLQKADLEDIPRIAAFSDMLLKQKYDVFLRKTEADYKRLLAELECENGGILFVMDEFAGQTEKGDGKGKGHTEAPLLRGILSYCKGEDALELKELLVSPADREIVRQLLKLHFPQENITISDMEFMVRILDLQTLVPLLKSSRELSWKVRVRDPMIGANQGSFWIRVNREGGAIVPIPETEAEETVEIGDLAARLFSGLRTCIREWV